MYVDWAQSRDLRGPDQRGRKKREVSSYSALVTRAQREQVNASLAVLVAHVSHKSPAFLLAGSFYFSLIDPG